MKFFHTIQKICTQIVSSEEGCCFCIFFKRKQRVHQFCLDIYDTSASFFFLSNFPWYITKQSLLTLQFPCNSVYLPNSLKSSSSSSCCASSTDLPDPLSPPVSIVYQHPVGFVGYILYRDRAVEYIVFSWSSCLCSFMWSGPREYVAYKFVHTSPTVSSRVQHICFI